jgi:enoyl-CoA hydratase/carnithine racemase
VENRPEWAHFRRLEQARKPVIAAIDGYAVGGGLELALLCDIRLATEASTFALPEPRAVGGVAEVAVHRLSRAIPLGEALYLHLTASSISARRAYEIGLVQHLAADRQAMFKEVDAIVERIAECDPDAVALGKFVSRRAPVVSVPESERILLELQRRRSDGSLREERGRVASGSK